jgi:hypothetical protein
LNPHLKERRVNELCAGLMLTPDFTRHGSLSALEQWIDRWNAQIVAAVPLWLTPVRIAYLYNGRASHEKEYPVNRETWHPNRSNVLDGRSLYLILRSANGDRSLQERVVRDKGRSVPDNAALAPTIRSQSLRTERYFSLVHSPDDAAALQFEDSLLFGTSGLLAAAADATLPIPISVIQTLLGDGVAELREVTAEPVIGALALGFARLTADPRVGLDRAALIDLLGELMAPSASVSVPLLERVSDILSPRTQVEYSSANSPSRAMAAATFAKLCAALALLRCPGELTQAIVDDISRCFREADIPIEKWTLHRLYLYATFHATSSTSECGAPYALEASA